tara:strand:- start:1484 stop:2434 length:951 start_codon:yes stop_codon:yes gene_type:complete
MPHPSLKDTGRHADQVLRGVLLMLAFCVLAPLLDVSAKLASAFVPVSQIAAARFVVQGALMLPVVLLMRLHWSVSPRILGLVILRAAMLLAATWCFIAAVAVMPIADALAIAFVEPFVLLILGRLIFGDEVGPRRIAASAFGFGGAMLVIQPSVTAFGWAALYPLGTAFTFAFYMLVTRAMSRRLHPVTMQLHTSLAGIAMVVPVLWAFNDGPVPLLDVVMPQGLTWLWLFGVGFWGSLSHICMTYALKFAPSATLAPLHYVEIVSAVTFGYLVFGDFPNSMTWVGIAVISTSGLYVIHRERVNARVRVTPPSPTH